MATTREKPRRPLTPPQAQRAASSVRLVHYVLARHGTRGLEYDDAVQEGCRGLMRAAMAYDPARGRWGTYAVCAVVRALLTAGKLRRNHPPPRRPAAEAFAPEADADLSLDLEEALLKIPARDARLLRDLHLLGLSYAQLTVQTGLQRGCLHQRARVARRRLAAAMAGYEGGER